MNGTSLHAPRARAHQLQALPALAVMMLTACTAVGPDHRVPAVPGADADWHTPMPTASEPSGESGTNWWQTLGDPGLDQLIEEALAQNLELRQATARLAEARALFKATLGRELPTLDARGSVSPRRQSENGLLPVGRIPGVERDQTLFDAAFDASWELDLFGRLRRGTESAQAQLGASEEEVQAVRLSVAAEVARSYLALRGGQMELAARQRSVAVARRLHESTLRRVQLGDASEADADRVLAQLDATQAAVPALQARVRAAALSLGSLIGRTPEGGEPWAQSPAYPVTLVAFPVGERAELLGRRPDVRAAERRLAAATADVGVAEAERFPRLVIGANAGFQAQSAADLFKPSSLLASVTPTISWRLLDGGRWQAQIDAADARRHAAALGYERAVLTALSDAERALSNYLHALQSEQAQARAVATANRAAAQAGRRYDLGDIGMAELLDSERALSDAQEQAARVRSAALADWVALVKALGGGWSSAKGDATVVSVRP